MNAGDMDSTMQDASRVSALEADLTRLRRALQHREAVWQANLRLAARVHQSLLPQPVGHPRISIEVRYAPMEGVGGDYCQVLSADHFNRSCYVTLCDVTGHDIAAALLATRVSSEVRHLVQAHARPSTIVRKLNSFIWRHFRDSHLLVSFFVSRIDLAAGRITYSSAGHPAQLLIRRGTGPIERLTTRNLLIGVDEDCLGDEPERDSKLRPTDRLVFFTDGVTETMNREGEFLGEDGLARIAAAACCPSLSEMADCVLERVNAFRAGPMRDDMTLILADFCPSRDPDVGS